MKALHQVKLENGAYSCEVLTNYGAALNSYKYKGVEFVSGYKSPGEIAQQQYKGVVLAPFPNRVAEAAYAFEGAAYQLPINREKEGLALHGLLYNKAFEILSQSKSELLITYSYKAEVESFPFCFILEIRYQLENNGRLKICATVTNNSEGNMPFGFGWHPYLQIGSEINELSLDFPASKKLLLNDKKIPTGKVATFLEAQSLIALKDYEFDDCFKLSNEEQVAFILSDGKQSLKVQAKSLGDFPYFQLYTPKDRQTIAIEPMTCAPDAFNNKLGLISMPSGSSKSFEYSIQAY